MVHINLLRTHSNGYNPDFDLTNSTLEDFHAARTLTNFRAHPLREYSRIYDRQNVTVYSLGIAQGAHLGRIPEARARRKDRSELSDGGDN